MHGYRDVIAIREVWTTLLLSAFIRIPIFSLGIVMSVHVVSSLHLDYVRAGVVTTVVTIATMISGPWRGSMVDRHGLRRTMFPSLIITTITWGLCPWLGYFPLLVLCAIGGLWNYPIFTIPRQVLMAAVPASRRRAALSLDSVSVEICYMIGPTASVIAATTIGTRSTITACGFIAAIGAAGLMVVNPATTEPSQDNPVPSAARTPTSAASVVQAPHNRKMAWLSPQSASILFAVVAAGFCLGGIELTTVAAMRSMGHPEMIGWVLAASGFGSAIGGVLYGALPRGASTALLLVFLGTLTALPALSSGPASTAILLFVGGVFCAPTITSSVDALTDLVPADSRGTIIGCQGSCLNGGTAMAAPLIGAVMDANGWQWGFLVAGIASAIIGATIWTMGWVIRKRQPA
ncbi:MFS transporter [Cutibacterium modestum]|uniref:MFS transporter n=1 Tax=Cutibacterium modestum TaxID=2559073 RepID=UPI0020A5975E|nr:MFS transporter [Cutibacterium modestum]MCP2377945.1 transporter, major facilitator family protein [Cutibacterium modestum 31N]